MKRVLWTVGIVVWLAAFWGVLRARPAVAQSSTIMQLVAQDDDVQLYQIRRGLAPVCLMAVTKTRRSTASSHVALVCP